jgi:hypothetical protein
MQALLQAIATVQVRIQARRSLYANSEYQTRYGLIDPVLRALDWDTSNPDEVQVDCDVKVSADTRVSGRADYLLMYQDRVLVVIEAKALGKLDQSAVSQGFTYCGALGAPLLVCTDGESWEIYDLNKPVASARTSQLLFSKDSTSVIAQTLLTLWKPIVCAGLSQPPSIFASAMPATTSATSNTTNVPTLVNAPPSHAIPLNSLPKLISQSNSFRPSAIYFPPNYSPTPIRYFNDIVKEVVLFLSRQSLIPQAGIPPIVLPSGSTVVNQRRYTLLGSWLTCTHGSASQVVRSAIRILRRCKVNPTSVYVS